MISFSLAHSFFLFFPHFFFLLGEMFKCLVNTEETRGEKSVTMKDSGKWGRLTKLDGQAIKIEVKDR